jgi:peptide/nickel transport system substrate-binding protein
MAILADESTVQPYTYVRGYPGWNMLTLIYDTLFVMDADNLPKPWVAREDKVSADGKVHTITLRNDVKWHDGKPLTSADVKFSFEFYQKNTHSRWTPPVRNMTSIETPNETTVVVTLSAPNPAFAIQLMGDVPIIPKHLWESVTEPKKFENNIGSGPYKLTEYKPEQFYRFVANPDYFAGRPAVDELVMPVIKEAATIFSSLKTGEIQATVRALAPELVKDFQGNPDLKIQRGPGYAATILQFNNERAPWSKKEVRQAVALAIDTQKLVDTVILGYGTLGNPGWLHPASPFHDPAVKGEYSAAKAQALLDGIGYKDTDNDGIREAAGKKMEGTLLVYSNNPTRIRTAELIAAGLKEIGISLKVTALEPASVDAKVWPDFDVAKGRDFDLAMWGWSAPIQVNVVRTGDLVHSDPKMGSINIGAYKNPAADKLAEELFVTTDPDKQKTLVRQLEALIAQELPFVTLFYEDGTYVYRPAAYDKWIYQKGQGIFHKLSFLPGVKP